VRLVAQSMGGWTCVEYLLSFPHKVRALVLASTCGTIHRPSVPLADPQQLTEWKGGGRAGRHAAPRNLAAGGRAHGARAACAPVPLSRDC
jgi:pimeloyl-ACP methyl ester carboxylesterase